MNRNLSVAAAVLVAVMACDSEPAGPPEGFPVAWAHNSCAPWDGPAVVLYLGRALPPAAPTVTYPHLMVSLYVSPSELPGHSFQWDGAAPNDGFARRCTSEGQCETASTLSVDFSVSDDPGVYVGNLDVAFPDGSAVAGTFSATKLPYQPLCG